MKAGFERLEPYEGKLSRTVLRGGWASNGLSLPDYLPRGYFGLLVVDEGHEYKNEGSAQGQAMGVLASQCQKTLLLTGTLMGGYADDLFHLLWRINPTQMIQDGFKPARNGSVSYTTYSTCPKLSEINFGHTL